MVTHLAPILVVAIVRHTETATAQPATHVLRTATATHALLTVTDQPMETATAQPAATALHTATATRALHTATAMAQAVDQLAAPHLAR